MTTLVLIILIWRLLPDGEVLTKVMLSLVASVTLLAHWAWERDIRALEAKVALLLKIEQQGASQTAPRENVISRFDSRR